jgi:hypothetical protein
MGVASPVGVGVSPVVASPVGVRPVGVGVSPVGVRPVGVSILEEDTDTVEECEGEIVPDGLILKTYVGNKRLRIYTRIIVVGVYTHMPILLINFYMGFQV